MVTTLEIGLALLKIHFKYQLHQDTELFEKVYEYIAAYC